MKHFAGKYAVLIIMFPWLLQAGTACAEVADSSRSNHINQQIELVDSLIDLRELDTATVLCESILPLAIREFGESDTTVAKVLRFLGKCFYHKAEYDSSETLYRRALHLRRQYWGEYDKSVAQSLNDLALLCVKQARYSEAEVLYGQTLTVLEEILGSRHKYVAAVLNNLGNLYCEQGKYTEAEPLYLRSLEIETETGGAGSAATARSQNNLGLVYMDMARYGEAEEFFKRALAAKEAIHGSEHPTVARSYNNLALLYMAQSRYEKAESLYVRTLSIFEATFGTEHPDVAHALTNLALLYQKQKRYSETILLHQRALAIRKAVLGDSHPSIARSLNNIGAIYIDLGEYQKAETAYREAMAIRMQALDPEHPDVAQSLYNVGLCRSKQGDRGEALQLYRQALTIRNNLFGPDHPIVAKTLASLAVVSALLRDYDGCLNFYEKELESKNRFIRDLFTYASEDLKMRYIEEYSPVDYTLLAFALDNRDSDRAKNLALNMILASKGIVIDALAAEKQFASCSYDEGIRRNLQRHAEICGEISTLTLVGADKLPHETYRERLRTLFSQKDSLETDLSKICGEFRDNMAQKDINVAEVFHRLPAKAVLWEFVRYLPYDFQRDEAGPDKKSVPRYAAFTLDAAGNVTLQDLGEAAVIDSLIQLIRERLYSDRSVVFSPFVSEAERRLMDLTGPLCRLIFEPLADHLDEKIDILIAPDGQLSLLPFEILITPAGKYVAEKYSISYLSCGRDVLRMYQRHETESRAVILANPEFTAAGNPSLSDPEESEDDIDYAMPDMKTSRRPDECLSTPFDPLPGTGVEADRVKNILLGIKNLEIDVFTGKEASEETIKSLNSPPRILHLATHGFFCEDANITDPNSFQMSLLRSGLAFSGANNIIPGPHQNLNTPEDGVLTAFEASGLNLLGTELVVLSACESGIGAVKNGEGVYGLRRAFQHAGARSIVMSLWRVPDEETLWLMDHFYTSWLAGKSKNTALRESILSIITRCREKYGSAHPYFWGAFILTGDPD